MVRVNLLCCKPCKWPPAHFLGLPYVNRRHINENEIRFAINIMPKRSKFFTPTIIEATESIKGSGEFTWRRVIKEHGKPTSSSVIDISQIKEIAEDYARSLNNIDRPMLPVIAFFDIKKLDGKTAREKRIKKNRIIIKDGYYNALGSNSNEDIFTQWFVIIMKTLKLTLNLMEPMKR